jgi:hypothetical protein
VNEAEDALVDGDEDGANEPEADVALDIGRHHQRIRVLTQRDR